MDYDKIEKQIKKISFMLDTFKEEDEISTMEKELLLDYTKKLYSLISGNESELILPEKKDKVVNELAKSYEPVIVQKNVTETVVENQHQLTTTIDNVKEPIINQETLIDQSAVETSINVDKVKSEPQNVPSSDISEGMNEVFAKREITDLSDKLSFSPIADLTKSMGINERILTVRELFGGDSDLFNTTINRLNKLNNYEEAKSYLLGGVARDYNWDSEEKTKKATQFVKLVQRRFV